MDPKSATISVVTTYPESVRPSSVKVQHVNVRLSYFYYKPIAFLYTDITKIFYIINVSKKSTLFIFSMEIEIDLIIDNLLELNLWAV